MPCFLCKVKTLSGTRAWTTPKRSPYQLVGSTHIYIQYCANYLHAMHQCVKLATFR